MTNFNLNNYKENLVQFHSLFNEFKVFAGNKDFPNDIRITNSFQILFHFMDYWTMPCEEEIEEMHEHYVDFPEELESFHDFTKIYDFLENLKSNLSVIYGELLEADYFALPHKAVYKNNLEFDEEFRKKFLNFKTNTFAISDFVNGVIRDIIQYYFLVEKHTGTIPIVEKIKEILVAGGIPCGVKPCIEITKDSLKEIDPEFLVFIPKIFKSKH